MLIHCIIYLVLAVIYTNAAALSDNVTVSSSDYGIIVAALLVGQFQLTFMLFKIEEKSSTTTTWFIVIQICLFICACIICWQLASLCVLALGFRRFLWNLLQGMQNHIGDLTFWKDIFPLLVFFFAGAWLIQYTKLNYLAFSYGWYLLLGLKIIACCAQKRNTESTWSWAL